MPSLAIDSPGSPIAANNQLLSPLAAPLTANFQDALHKLQDDMTVRFAELHEQLAASHYKLVEGQALLGESLSMLRSDLAHSSVPRSLNSDDGDDDDHPFSARLRPGPKRHADSRGGQKSIIAINQASSLAPSLDKPTPRLSDTMKKKVSLQSIPEPKNAAEEAEADIKHTGSDKSVICALPTDISVGSSRSQSLVVRRNSYGISELSQIVKGHKYNDNFIDKRPGFDTHRKPASVGLQPSAGKSFHRLDDLSEYVEIPKWCMALNPDKPFRTFLDITAIFMLLHDAIMVPYLMCWNVPDSDYQLGIWATRIFWTVDLPVSFFTGYRKKDQRLEVRIIPSMKHYLRTWFVPDVSLVMVDWLGYLMKDLAWIRSALRVFRLLRAFSKIPRAADLWARMVLASEKKEVQVMMGIFRMMFMILWFNHVISCGWYAIGKFSTADTGETWIFNTKAHEYQQGALYEYTTALHWALTQMSPASMEVVPMCSSERIYTVAVIFFGLVLGSTLIATMSSIMTQYRLQLEERTKKFLQLQQFLTQQKVSSELCTAIKRYVRINLSKNQMLKRRDVAHLKEIPKAMQQELNCFLYTNIIHQHPFFNPLGLINNGDPLRALCNNAFSVFDCRAGDYLFEENTAGDKMFFVADGRFKYLPGVESVECLFPQDGDQLILKRGDWCCEPALWTLWEHLGSMYVTSMAEVLFIGATEVQKELGNYPHAMSIVSAYCAAFHENLNQVGVLRSDLPFRYDYTDILCSMQHNERVALGMSAIEQHKQQKSRSKRARARNIFQMSAGCDRLADEVKAGKCHVTLVGSEVERAVSVAALRLGRRSDSRFLVNVGQFENNGLDLSVTCQLPGVKKRHDEMLAGALKRLIDTELRSLSKDVEMYLEHGSTRTSVLKDSPTYGIKTRYARSTFHGLLKDGTKLPSVRVPPEAHRAASGFHSVFDLAMSTADYAVKKQVVQVLGSIEKVYVLNQEVGMARKPSQDQVTNGASKDSVSRIYVWLTGPDFEVLSHPRAEFAIRQWILNIDFNDSGDGDKTTNKPKASRWSIFQKPNSRQLDEIELEFDDNIQAATTMQDAITMQSSDLSTSSMSTEDGQLKPKMLKELESI